jgi:ASC-1-like (ASCH) protein
LPFYWKKKEKRKEEKKRKMTDDVQFSDYEDDEDIIRTDQTVSTVTKIEGGDDSNHSIIQPATPIFSESDQVVPQQQQQQPLPEQQQQQQQQPSTTEEKTAGDEGKNGKPPQQQQQQQQQPARRTFARPPPAVDRNRPRSTERPAQRPSTSGKTTSERFNGNSHPSSRPFFGRGASASIPSTSASSSSAASSSSSSAGLSVSSNGNGNGHRRQQRRIYDMYVTEQCMYEMACGRRKRDARVNSPIYAEVGPGDLLRAVIYDQAAATGGRSELTTSSTMTPRSLFMEVMGARRYSTFHELVVDEGPDSFFPDMRPDEVDRAVAVLRDTLNKSRDTEQQCGVVSFRVVPVNMWVFARPDPSPPHHPPPPPPPPPPLPLPLVPPTDNFSHRDEMRRDEPRRDDYRQRWRVRSDDARAAPY